MQPTAEFGLPTDQQQDMRRAQRLEWLTLAYLATVICLMYLVMGSSQAMQTAWIEDLLSLVPPIGFLIAARVRYLAPNERYPYGYHRAINIAYFCSATALLAMGVFLLIDAVMKLVEAKHPTIGSVDVLGNSVWLGWLMMPVLAWATIPAFLLGRAKLGIAKRLHDKPLYADAEMNKADWMTGAAAGAGVLGIAWGWWWADAVAAGLISLDILKDGVNNIRAVVGDLMDRAPMTVDHKRFLDLPDQVTQSLRKLKWIDDVAVRLREHGHVLFGDIQIVVNDDQPTIARRNQILRRVKSLDWRLHEVTVEFVKAVTSVRNDV